jgi:hypothetical protein
MARKKVVLRGTPREESFIASGAIRPGMLVEPTSTGHMKAHDTEGAAAATLFAREQHENDGADLDANIASGDEVTVVYAQPGDKINAVTDDTIDKDEWVESAGNGKVQPYNSGYRIGYAAAASDLSGSVGRVEIIIAPVGV